MGIFTRHLLFPTATSPNPPMWDRRSPGTPIFIDAYAPSSPMWSRPGTGYPIYEEAVPSPSPMWHRPGAAPAPACPCCMHVASGETVASSSRPGTSDTVSSAVDSARRPSLRSVPSGLGLRLKKSFRSLRTKASRSTL